MRDMPVKVQVVKAQEGMTGSFGIVVVIEGFERKEDAAEHAKYLGQVIENAGFFKNDLEEQVQKEVKKEKKPKHIKLLTD